MEWLLARSFPHRLPFRAHRAIGGGGVTMLTVDEAKREAGRAACRFLKSGMRIGLGTGSTAWFTTECVGEAWKAGTRTDIVVVPTSERTAEQARGYGLPIADLNDVEPL